ncbi:GNAT family N-acetyltransferase [Alkalihalophilus marmarensis]|uniref:N-acetyltransferase domain-containing protein n=1 Tax=Alkalihalophilus marmarensis DSM 21297 TaxID=1188261 RepID=U6SST9_9BACI|nr:GNAT family N-acetyltransferase [Alkalihalophilus marmarensis]ERN53965.1 hypothetical protein A33I_09175 [Alkalihalophilus marmarensis DSM 21297]MCM3491134.1 GNAT family N-acetyltransferase [Alkalihalophilus marmarensis]
MSKQPKTPYIIRQAAKEDAAQLSEVRLQIDGETEFMDRERGEAFLSKADFEQIIEKDNNQDTNLFLVAEAEGKVIGFARCAGNSLKRTSHKVDFGICVLKAHWGQGIGKCLLQEAIEWSDENNIKKIALQVIETNHQAIKLYKRHGFQVEGRLRFDKWLSDNNYYDTLLMGRITKVSNNNT